MNTRIVLQVLAVSLACTFSPAWGQESYDARIATKEVLTPAPPKKPTLNGPKVYGARPGMKLIYRIPCQGERPMRFHVSGLSPGLRLDAQTGIITGTAPEKKGDHVMTFTANNSQGQAARPFKLVVGDKLALTPPTGWNSWGGHMYYVSDKLMRRAADIIVETGLADVGFQYVSIDDCWMRVSPETYATYSKGRLNKNEGFSFEGIIGAERDARGDILPNVAFPDMKGMTDYIHGYGLKAGIYSSPGPYTCQQLAGSWQHEEQDAAQYARWGFDLLKYDLCTGGETLKQLQAANPDYQQADFWQPMARALRTQDRDILFNLCQYGRDNPWTWAPGLGIQSWRTGGDLNHHVEEYFNQALRLATELRAYSKPGQWNDPDFMYLQLLRDHRKTTNALVEIPLNTNQRYQYVTLWSIISAPFFFSCTIDQMDAFTIGLLANADVLNINQDELGHVAEIVRRTDNELVMVKNLVDGARAVALFNLDATDEARIKLGPDLLSASTPVSVYDVWRQRVVENLQSGDTVRLSPNGVALFIVR